MTEEVVIGSARLILGDCREILPTLGMVAAVVSDPPYGMAFSGKGGLPAAGKRITNARPMGFGEIVGDQGPFDPAPLLSLGAPTALWGANHFAHRLPPSRGWLIWDKRAGKGGAPSFGEGDLAWTSLDRPMRVINHYWNGAFRASEINVRKVHPTQKPIAVMEWCIEQLGVKPPGTILDPYMGGGTTGVAAVRRGHRFIGIEIERRWFDAACKRVEEAQREPALIPEAPRHDDAPLRLAL